MSKRAFYSEGKTTYFVRGQRFVNDANIRNGRKKAEDYCLENFIPTDEIIVFDSMLECDRYEHLKWLESLGQISNLRHHVSLPLLPEFVNYNGDTLPELRYNADFVYEEKGKHIVEDVKGASLFQDSRFEAIKQLFDYKYREKAYIRIIIYRDKQWVEWKFGDSKKPQKLIKKQREEIRKLKAEAHAKEVAENLKQREIARLKELRELASHTKLTSVQRKRLAELEEKYKV